MTGYSLFQGAERPIKDISVVFQLVTGDGFLLDTVKILVAALVSIGRAGCIPYLLAAKRMGAILCSASSSCLVKAGSNS